MNDDTLRILLNEAHRFPEEDMRLLVAADRADECDAPNLAWILRVLGNAGPLMRVATGSRAYGAPRPDSDYDWVLRVPQMAYNWLWERRKVVKQMTTRADEHKTLGDEVDGPCVSATYRFGPVNLIRVTTDEQLSYWREGTDRLILQSTMRRVTRWDAIHEFDTLARSDMYPSINPANVGY